MRSIPGPGPDGLRGREPEELRSAAMEYDIAGVLNQTLSFRMGPGERLWVQKSALVSYTSGVAWRPRVPGGLFKIISRHFSGESVFLLDVEARSEARLQIAAPRPSLVYDWDLSEGPVTTLRGNFLAALGRISIDVGIASNPLAALFGGAGLLLQTVSGEGRVFIAVQGDLIDYDIPEGRSVLVSTGNLAAFSSGVDYSIRTVGGCLKMVFGGEGLFMTRLAGPGRVLVQNLKRPSETLRKVIRILDLIPA